VAKRTWRRRILTALPFTDNAVSVVAGLLAIVTFVAGGLGYVAKTERDERNELEGAVASLERQGDDLRETNDTLTAENDSLRDENEDLAAQVADLEDNKTTVTTTTTVTPSPLPSPTSDYRQVYGAQDLVLTISCTQQNAADLDVPKITAVSNYYDVDYHCGTPAPLRFTYGTRHAAGPPGATAEQCADVIRRAGIGDGDTVIPSNGAVLCVLTHTGSEDIPARVVRMVVTAVDDGESVTVNVEAWEPD
jgi:cell division protein FtsB